MNRYAVELAMRVRMIVTGETLEQAGNHAAEVALKALRDSDIKDATVVKKRGHPENLTMETESMVPMLEAQPEIIVEHQAKLPEGKKDHQT